MLAEEEAISNPKIDTKYESETGSEQLPFSLSLSLSLSLHPPSLPSPTRAWSISPTLLTQIKSFFLFSKFLKVCVTFLHYF